MAKSVESQKANLAAVAGIYRTALPDVARSLVEDFHERGWVCDVHGDIGRTPRGKCKRKNDSGDKCDLPCTQDGAHIMSHADRIKYARSFAEDTALHQAIIQEMGLGPLAKKVENHQHFTQIKLSVEEFAQLPEPLRERFMVEQLGLLKEAK